MTIQAAFPAIRTGLLAGLLLALPAAAGAAPKTRDPLQQAERVIARCFDYAASQKLPPLSVGVIDASGTLVAFRRQAGAASVTAEAALLKAKTAARLNAPTALLGPAVAGDASTRDAFLILQLTTLPGGAPLNDGDGMGLGAVGVSGGSDEQDAECARRAAESPAVDGR